ncbi:MAG: hypothetical protein PWQ54_190 [Bacteroidales bacterium]|jgi:hypothetical protein|nr:hypothetical protein [Bacteroidales bacterium]
MFQYNTPIYRNLAPKSRLMRTIFILVLLGFSFLMRAQDQQILYQHLTEERLGTLRQVLNYRFKGGAGEFERVMNSMVDYTPEARKNCIIGVMIMKFTVSCDNELGDLSLRNPLHYGLNEKVQEFLESTKGMWNTCKDDRYTRFEVPVLFTLEGTETSARGLVTIIGETPGFSCRSDAWYLERFEKFKEKGKSKRALEMLDQLLRRDPYNNSYYDYKRELLGAETTE